jgi:O-antigen ligase
MRVLTLYRSTNIPLVGVVIGLSVLAGVAVGMSWSQPLAIAGALALFLILVRDIRLIVPLLLVLIPFGPKFEMPFGSLYLATAVLVIGFAAWFWRNPLLAAPFRFPLNPILISLAVLFAILLLSALKGLSALLGDPPSLLRLIQFFLYTLLFVMIVQTEFSMGEIKALLVVTLLAGVVEGILGLLQWLTRPGFYISGTFDGAHNHFAIFCVFIALLLVGVILESGTRGVRVAGLVGLSILIFGITFSFSRGGYISLAAGLLVFLWLPVRGHAKLALVVGSAAVVAVVYLLTPQPIKERAYSIYTNLAGAQTGISLELRLGMWRRGITYFLENPILGNGVWTTGLKDNFYFKILAEAGILGFASFLGLFYAVLREEWRTIGLGIEDRFMRGVTLGMLPASVACLVVYNLSGDFFGVHRFMGVFWIVLALVMKYASSAGHARESNVI